MQWLKHRFDIPFLLGVCALSFLLWLPAAGDPIVSDTVLYALLGKSVWTEGTYAVIGELHGKHLPLHAIVSYPFVEAFGLHLGMKILTLLQGFGVLVALYALLLRTFSMPVAVLATLVVTLHHGFIVMTMLGSADLLLTLLFLLTLHAYLNAERDKRWYIVLGFFLGLACLTRYNAVPLFLFFPLYTLWKRRRDLLSVWFISGMLLGIAIFSLWFLRAYLVFGALTNDYTTELEVKSVGLMQQFFINVTYYIHPVRNILPIPLLLSIFGIWRACLPVGRPAEKQIFLIIATFAIASLFAVWPVLNLRYLFPAYALLLGFAAFGAVELYRLIPRGKVFVMGALALVTILSGSAALCLYSYGACNAWFDRAFGYLPKNMGLATEGFYTWDLARDWVNENAEPNAEIVVIGKENSFAWSEGVFREDLNVVTDTMKSCPSYEITQHEFREEDIVFQTEDQPIVYVVTQCK